MEVLNAAFVIVLPNENSWFRLGNFVLSLKKNVLIGYILLYKISIENLGKTSRLTLVFKYNLDNVLGIIIYDEKTNIFAIFHNRSRLIQTI